MAKAEIPDAVLAPPTEEELAAAKKYARLQASRIGDGSLLHDAAGTAVATASRNEVAYRAELELITQHLEKQPENESLIARVPRLRERLCKALRDQGRLYEAMEYADTPTIKDGLERGVAALNRDDNDFECPEGCEDTIIEIAGQSRFIPRWGRVKQDIPRHRNGSVELVTLWRCSKCGDMNASQNAPKARAVFDKAIAKASKGSNDAEVMPVYHAE